MADKKKKKSVAGGHQQEVKIADAFCTAMARLGDVSRALNAWRANGEREAIQDASDGLQLIGSKMPVVGLLPKHLHELKQMMEGILNEKFEEQQNIPDPPMEWTEELLAKAKSLGLEPFYLPEKEIISGNVPDWWILPRDEFYQWIRDGKIAKDSAKIYSGWILADVCQGVDYTDGTQVFPNDPLAPIIIKLREQKKVGKCDKTPAGSRFAIIPKNEWPLVCEAVLKELDIDSKKATCRLERAIEFNTIGNLYDSNRGKFNMWEWFADDFKDSRRLIGGSRDGGGLADVSDRWSDNRSDDFAARPLVSFA